MGAWPWRRYARGMTDGVRDEARCLLLTGTVGAGKTTTASAVGDLLRERGVPHAVVDLDELRRAWPAPPDDPFNSELERANLAAVAANHRRAGAERLVLAGVVETPAMRAVYERCVGLPIVVCRLRVDLGRVRERLVGRHAPGVERDWHLHRSGELDRVLDDEEPADVVVDVADDPPAVVAAMVLNSIGWE